MEKRKKGLGFRDSASRHANREVPEELDRKSTRLNSSHSQISYAVFCLKKKKRTTSCDPAPTGYPPPQRTYATHTAAVPLLAAEELRLPRPLPIALCRCDSVLSCAA